jgi:hypothetical protein
MKLTKSQKQSLKGQIYGFDGMIVGAHHTAIRFMQRKDLITQDPSFYWGLLTKEGYQILQ